MEGGRTRHIFSSIQIVNNYIYRLQREGSVEWLTLQGENVHTVGFNPVHMHFQTKFYWNLLGVLPLKSV